MIKTIKKIIILFNIIYSMKGLAFTLEKAIEKGINIFESEKKLNLTGCQIESLKGLEKYTLTNLEMLSFSRNKLTQLPDNFGNTWTNLQQLYLHDNQLKELPRNFGVDLFNLKRLELDKNQLRELPDSISELTALTILNLNNNQLTKLPNTISKLIALTYLNLNNNQLATLPNTLDHLSELHTLCLSNNQLSEEEKEKIRKIFGTKASY